MIRVFNYINISNSKNIWADSGYHVQRNVINYILRKRDDFFFYVTVPHDQIDAAKRGFEYPDRVLLIPIKYSTAGALNKLFLDLAGLRTKFKWRRYFVNIIWSNEAYLTPYILQLFKGTFPFADASVATYVHWVEIPELNRLGSPEKGNWLLWLLATTAYWSDVVFFNSKYGVNLVLPYFQKFLREDIFGEIESKLRPLYLGINVEELDKYKHGERSDVPLIVFNQRMMQYTGATKVVRVAKRLADHGYKFKLVFTNPSHHSVQEAYGEAAKKYSKYIQLLHGLPYPDYIRLLWKADAVVAWHTGFNNSGEDKPVNQWSIALLEAIACNTYPVVHNNGFFTEMLPREVLLSPKEDSLYAALVRIIEDPDYYRRKAHSIAQYVREKYDWRVRINDWISAYEYLYNLSQSRASIPTVETVIKIKRLIEKKKRITWNDIANELRWGYQIKVGRSGVYYWLCRNYKELPLPEPTWESVSKKKSIRKWL